MLIKEKRTSYLDLIDYFLADWAEEPLYRKQIKEEDDRYIVELAVPGCDKGDVKVKTRGHVLEVSVKKGNEGDRYFLKYRISLGMEGIDFTKARSKLSKGLLTITLPKTEIGEINIEVDE